MSTDESDLKIQLQRVLTNRAAPKAAHHFLITKVGEEYLLEIGHVDLVELNDLIQTAKKGGDANASSPKLSLYVTDRIAINEDAWKRLCEAVETIKGVGAAKVKTKEVGD